MLTIANTLENLDKLVLAEKQVQASEEYCLGMIPNVENKIAQLDKTLDLIAEAREYWRKAIDVAYERSVGELNNRLNSAIKYIYFDRDFTVELTLEDKRGKSLLILLKDEEGNEVSLKDGTGMGVRTIISVILHMYYLHAKGSHVLLVDEKYSYLSESYIPKFFEFLTRLCVAMDFKLIVITHDPRFFDYANKKIRVVSGEVKYE